MRRLAVATLAILTAACVKTNVETMTPPDWEPQTFQKIVVYYATDNLDSRKQVENRFASKDSAFVPAYSLAFSGQNVWSTEQILEVVTEHDAEAALVIEPKDFGVSQATINTGYTTTCTSDDCASAVTTGGPQTFDAPHASFRAAVIPQGSDEPVWAASAASGGDALADFNDIRDSLVDEMVKRLREDGLLDSSTE